MSTYPFREELRVSTLVVIVAICLMAVTVAGHFRPARAHIGEEIPQTTGIALSLPGTPGSGDESAIRFPR